MKTILPPPSHLADLLGRVPYKAPRVPKLSSDSQAFEAVKEIGAYDQARLAAHQ